MTIHKAWLLAAPAVLFSLSAHAADAVLDQEPAPPVSEYVQPADNWTGFYVGGQIGGAFGDSGIFTMDRDGDGRYGDYLPAFDPSVNPAAGGFDGSFSDGVTGGVHAGYDWQVGNVVLGGLIDLSFTDIGDRQSGYSSTPAFYDINRDLDYLATLRGRLGYAFTPAVMAYATGGLAYGEVDYSFSSDTPAAFSSSGGSDSDFGYTVGGGVEAKVTQNISFGVEYLYTNLGGNDYTVNLSGPAAFSGPGSAGSTNARGSDSDFDFHTVQLRMSYRF